MGHFSKMDDLLQNHPRKLGLGGNKDQFYYKLFTIDENEIKLREKSYLWANKK